MIPFHSTLRWIAGICAVGFLAADPAYGITVTGKATVAELLNSSSGDADFCATPVTKTDFLTSDPVVGVWITLTDFKSGDKVVVNWIHPSGAVDPGQPAITGGGCWGWFLGIAGNKAAEPGNWQVRLVANGSVVFSLPFTITNALTPSSFSAVSFRNTGQNRSGGRDTNFQIISDTTTQITTPGAAFVATSLPGWGVAVPGAVWIAPSADQSDARLGGCCQNTTDTYRTTFTVAGDPTMASLTLAVLADDYVDVTLNGRRVFTHLANNMLYTPTILTIDSGFISGTNTVDFAVSNISGPTGLLVGAVTQASLNVQGTGFATSTGVWLSAEQSYQLNASGTVNLANLDGPYTTNADGIITAAPPAGSGAYGYFTGSAGPVGAPPKAGESKSMIPPYVTYLQNAPYGALVAGFSANPAPKALSDFPSGFVRVGASGIVKAPASGGFLYLAVNDYSLKDNAGSLLVKVVATTVTAPVISFVSPTSVAAGGGEFTLTVSGSGFAASSIVTWNGAQLATSFVDSSQLTAAVPANLIAAPGTATIAVSSGGAVSGSLPVLIAHVPTFTARSTVAELLNSSSGSSDFCATQVSKTDFLTSDPAVGVWLTLTDFKSDDKVMVNWIHPTGAVDSWQPPITGGGCWAWFYGIAGNKAAEPGNWQVRLVANGVVVFSLPFTISNALTASSPSAVSFRNTGQSVSGGRDNSFQIISDTTGQISSPAAAFVATLLSSWGTAVPGAVWIAPSADQSDARLGGCCRNTTDIYRTTFTVTGDATTASLTLAMLADDYVDVLLNGQRAFTHATNNMLYTPTSFTMNSGFVAGANTLDFVVTNISGPTGLLVGAVSQASLNVQATGFATNTGIWVSPGQSYQVNADGSVNLANLNGPYTTNADGIITAAPPAGSGAYDYFTNLAGPVGVAPKANQSKLMIPPNVTYLTNAPYGALVAGFSSNPTPKVLADFSSGFVLVGASGIVTAPASGGYLSFAVNDYNLKDNAGSFLVTAAPAVVTSPTISSVSPASMAAGSSTFTLTVAGSNFTSSSTVTWNGSRLATTFVSSSQLTAAVTSNLVATPGTVTLAVDTAGASSKGIAFVVSPANVKITINSNPAGRAILVDGAPAGTPADFQWAPASLHALDIQSPQGVGLTRYRFSGWSNGGSLSQTITTPSAGASYTATFVAQSLLTTTVSPANGGSVAANRASADGFYDQGTEVQLTATAGSGFSFANFTGDLTGSTNSQTIMVSAPKSVVANFTAVTPLTVVPSQLSLSAAQGANATGALQVDGGAAGQIVAVSVDQTWLRVNPGQGTVPFNVTVVAASGGLSPGNYTGHVTIGGALAVNVSFNVSAPPPGAHLVTSALAAGQQFSLFVSAAAPAEQEINVTSSDSSALNFMANVTYPSGTRSWVSLSARSGQTPATLQVGVQVAALGIPATYTALLVLSADGSPEVSIPLTLAFTNPPTSQIQVDVKDLKLSSAGDVQRTSLVVRNSGPGTLPFTASIQTDDNGNWLKVSPTSASAVDQQAAVVQVSADPIGLASGTYGGTVTITDANNNTSAVRVVFALMSAPGTKLLRSATTGLTTRVSASQRALPPEQVVLLAYGTAAVSWTAQADKSWIQVTPLSGTIAPGGTTGSPLVSFDLAQLQVGSNKGLITVKSDAIGGDLAIPVEVQVLPAGVNVNRLVPTGMVFVPPFQPREDAVYVPADPNSKLTLISNQGWLKVEDITTGFLAQVRRLRITVDGSKVPVGSPQPGLVVIQEQSTGTFANLAVLAYAPGGGNANRSKRSSRASAAVCMPSLYIPLATSFLPNFEQNGGAATSTEIVMIDNCGNPVTSGVTGAVLGNGDPQLNLRPLGDGRWKATWNPSAANSYVTLNIIGADPDNNINPTVPVRAASSITGTPTGPVLDKQQPFETEAGVRLPAVAPNGRFRIRGQNFLNSDVSPPNVLLGGRKLDIVNATNSQIVVVTPADLTVNVEMQMVVQRVDGVSVPEPVIVAPAWLAVAGAGGSSNEVILTGLGNAAAEFLTVDGGAKVLKVERVSPGLWRVVADRDLREAKFRVEKH